MNFCSQKLKRSILATGRATQPKLQPMFCTKIEEEDIGNFWFQQVGAACHTADATLNVLRPVFEDCIISRRADVGWPPRSSDLTPCDYYL